LRARFPGKQLAHPARVSLPDDGFENDHELPQIAVAQLIDQFDYALLRRRRQLLAEQLRHMHVESLRQLGWGIELRAMGVCELEEIAKRK
jgi:hypothetical protein